MIKRVTLEIGIINLLFLGCANIDLKQEGNNDINIKPKIYQTKKFNNLINKLPLKVTKNLTLIDVRYRKTNLSNKNYSSLIFDFKLSKNSNFSNNLENDITNFLNRLNYFLNLKKHIKELDKKNPYQEHLSYIVNVIDDNNDFVMSYNSSF